MIHKFIQWLRDHSLVWCVRCQRLMFSKDARFRMTTTGFFAALCADCEREIFHPWDR